MFTRVKLTVKFWESETGRFQQMWLRHINTVYCTAFLVAFVCFLPCIVPRPKYFASVIRFGSRGPGRSSGIRHRNQLTVKAWGKALQERGNFLSKVQYCLLKSP